MDSKIELLIAHGVDVDCKRDRLLAFERATKRIGDAVVDVSQWLDVTDWSIREVYHWLGY